MRKIGVEEELLLVDPETRELAAVSQHVIAGHHALEAERARAMHGDSGTAGGGRDAEGTEALTVDQEIFLQQLETATVPCTSLAELESDLRRCRRVAAEAAATAGAAIVAVGTAVVGNAPAVVTPNARYQRIIDEFGSLIRNVVVSGMHVHVSIEDDEEGVGVIDRVRPWLPILLALSANSPFVHGVDTGFASWRSQMWGRWPSAGPTEPYGDAAGYHAVAEAMMASGASMDRGMLYYDARLAETWPTVEIRVADVCTEVGDAVLVAALTRALVETAARSWRADEAPPAWRTDLLRAAQWRAARYGVAGQLMHPQTRELQPARMVVESLMAHTAEALAEADDTELVAATFQRLLARGAGASRQRAIAEARGSLTAVVDDLIVRTNTTSRD
ncbi:MAG: glutamate--cysteine ligase [Nocardioidaceae bacterium]|nr:glutamate--cysteine ligase [Nocardioidaceae bacterium]